MSTSGLSIALNQAAMSLTTSAKLHATDVLKRMRSKGVKLWAENGQLRYQAPKGALNAVDLAQLRSSKIQLVALLEGASVIDTLAPRPRQTGSGDPIPLTYSQLTHWNWYRLGERRHLRQIASATRIEGHLNVDALRAVLAELVRRHEALRTSIVTIVGSPMQIVHESAVFELECTDLMARDEHDREAEVRRLIHAHITQPVDVTKDPLVSALLMRTRADENVLIVALEHLIADGVSMNLLLRDLFTAYRQVVGGQPISLPAIQVQLADYAAWQANARASWLEARRVYWQEHLQGCERLRVPDPRAPTSVARQSWGTTPVKISAPLRAELRQCCKQMQTTLVMGVFTAYVALVLRWCQVSDAVIRFQIDGRMSSDLENTVGCFPSALNLRVRFRDEDTFHDLSKRVLEEYCDAYQHCDFGFLEAQLPRPGYVHNSAFNWLPQPPPRSDENTSSAYDDSAEAIRCSALLFEHPMLDHHTRDAEPVLLLFEGPDEVIGDVYFPRTRFSDETMQQFGASFLAFVEALLRQPQQRVMDVPLAR